MMARFYTDIDLHAFVDDQVGTDRRDAIAAYLKTAPADAARVELWRRQNEAVRSIFAGPMAEPVPLWLTVGQIAAAPERPIQLQKRPSAKHPARPLRQPSLAGTSTKTLLLAVAFAFVAGVAVPVVAAHVSLPGFLQPILSGAEAPAFFAQRAREAHETFAVDEDHAVDVVDRPQGNLRAWLRRRLSFAVNVPDLTDQGWTLLGARLAPGNSGPGALLVFQRGAGERLSLYAARLGQSRGSERVTTDPHGVAFWSDGPVGYALVSTLSTPWLEHNAEALKASVHDDRAR